MRKYRLRVTLKDVELILDYRAADSDEWIFAAGCEFSDPAQAQKEFGALRAVWPPAYAVREAFREWNCEIPAALRSPEAVFAMNEFDFVAI